MTQRTIFGSAVRLQSQVITRRRDFEELFQGFNRLRAVSYVASPELLLDLFKNRGFLEMEVIVGENLTENYRQALAKQRMEVTEELASLVEQGMLRILVPSRTIHSKLYILQGPDGYRTVNTSANLTEAARQAAGQVNYAWYADLPPDDPWLAMVLRDYDAHRSRCTLFMGDLLELFRRERDGDRREITEAWLKGGFNEEPETETRDTLQELSARTLAGLLAGTETVIQVRLPNAAKAKAQVEKILAPLQPAVNDHHLTVDAHALVQFITRTQDLPLMQVDVSGRTVLLTMHGPIENRCEAPQVRAAVAEALAHLERYVETVDWGQANDALFAKTSMFEALLYVLVAPFAHEQMKIRRRSFGRVDYRGPQPLYIFGHAQNGKSTFLRFALRLLTGRHVDPQPGSSFTKTRVRNASAFGTAFPLMFDDVDLARKGKPFEEVLKSHWEVGWTETAVTPQLLFTGNAENLKEWAKSRLKRIDFDVQFAPNGEQKAELARLLNAENPLFKWFSYIYLGLLEAAGAPSQDELESARETMQHLYRHAGRPIPPYFPTRPVDELYNPGQRAWTDLFKLRKARRGRDGNRLLVEFKDEMQYKEITAYRSYLPQTVKTKPHGKTLVIENPREFDEWLRATQDPQGRWWTRVWGQIKAR